MKRSFYMKCIEKQKDKAVFISRFFEEQGHGGGAKLN